LIGIQLQGRLGNQLFQYAFIYATAKTLDTTFLIDQSVQEFLLPAYFNIPGSRLRPLEENIFTPQSPGGGLKNQIKQLLRAICTKCLFKEQADLAVDANDNEVVAATRDRVMFKGYFLSEKYFTSYANEIAQCFTIRDDVRRAYESKYNKQFAGKKLIALHIRKADYKNLGHLNLGNEDLSIPLTYYRKLIDKLQSPEALFVFLSDDPLLVEKEFAYLENKLISRDTIINDFQHMMRADVCIIANSTFSWWAAWLNRKVHKVIYAPQYFLGHYISKTWPRDIYPCGWLQVNVHHPVRI